jgi:hypothetical protein
VSKAAPQVGAASIIKGIYLARQFGAFPDRRQLVAHQHIESPLFDNMR